MQKQYQQTFFDKNKEKLTKLVIFIIGIDLLLNYYYRNSLYLYGVQLIAQLQNQSSGFGRLFNRFITSLSQPATVCIGIFGIFLIQKQKKHSINVVMFILLNLFFIVLLKSFYSDPRPFWTSAQIVSQSPSCPHDYGNPSGHTWFTSISSILLIFQYLPKVNKLHGIFISALLTGLVGFSRMYLGAHSLNQVMLGATLGYSFCFMYYVCNLKMTIYKFLINFNTAPMLGWKKYMAFLHCLYIFAFIVTKKLIQQNKEVYQSYSNALKQKCGTQISPNNLNFDMMIASALLVNFATGIAMGYDSMHLVDRGQKYLNGLWQINEQRYEWIYGAIQYYAVQIVLLVFGFILVVPIALSYDYYCEHYWQIVYIVISFAAWSSGYLYTSKSCYLLYRFRIISQNLE